MKKVLFATVMALAFGAHAFAARMQAADVRVGPLADEREKPAAAATPVAPKTDDKKAESKPDPKNDPKNTVKDDKKGEAEKSPDAISSTALTNAPAIETNEPSATSDAPAKTSAIVPPVTPAKNDPVPTGASGASDPKTAPAATAVSATTTTSPPRPALPLTAIYRIGVGDVLDIRLMNQPATRESTLYTVMGGGLLEYPLAGDPLVVAGMTTEEVGASLEAELKRRAVYEKPQVTVSVREYTSHTALIGGLVSEPGHKVMRREAVPLYVLIAEAQPRPEAGRALLISRATGQTNTIDLADPAATNVLVYPGDVINVQVRPKEFFYIGGQINAPGQKDFHAGLTLTQAVLASGGMTRFAGSKVKVSRQGPDGRLVATEYSLKEIESGKVPDPRLQPGDRVEVGRGRW